jgi:hypothetical protein
MWGHRVCSLERSNTGVEVETIRFQVVHYCIRSVYLVYSGFINASLNFDLPMSSPESVYCYLNNIHLWPLDVSRNGEFDAYFLMGTKRGSTDNPTIS